MKVSRNNAYWNFINMHSKKRKGIKSNIDLFKDQYIHFDNSAILPQKKENKTSGRITKEDLDYINFEYVKIAEQQGETIDYITVGNRKYLKKDLPEVDYERGKEIKAENNRIVLENKQYYRYQDKSGNKHVFACDYNRLDTPYSDCISENLDEENRQICLFWNLLATDATYLGLYFTDEQEKQMLNDAGITEGFFTVQIGDRKQEYFYSNGTAGHAVRKREYDAVYNMYVGGSPLFTSYEIGDVFKFGGNEYVLNEQRKFDIPYGEDIFLIQDPPSKYGVWG